MWVAVCVCKDWDPACALAQLSLPAFHPVPSQNSTFADLAYRFGISFTDLYLANMDKITGTNLDTPLRAYEGVAL